MLGKIFTIGISSLEGECPKGNAANIHPGWIKFSMAVLQPGFPLPRAKVAFHFPATENRSAKGFRSRSFASRKKFWGKGKCYVQDEEESHDASHPVSPCFACAFQSKSTDGKERDASKFPRQRDGSAVKKKSLDGSCITMPLDGMRTACESGC